MDPLKHAPLKIYDIRNKYKVIDKVGRGTYGTVFKVQSLEDNKYYAIKKFQNTEAKLQVEGFPITALRQISLLKQLNHPNIINLKQIICSKPNKRNLFRGSTFLVFEYMHHDFSGLFRSKIKFTQPEIKCLMKQILQGCNYLHKNKIMHRDIKSANILLNDNGNVQLADFGLGRRTRFQSVFTYKVVTLWYRAPELLLGCKSYNHKVDVWSIGCVFAQFLIGDVLFKKQTQYAIIQKIYQICGDLDQNQYTQQYLRGCVYYNDMKPKKSFKNNLFSYIKKLNPQVDNLSLQFLKVLLELNPYKRLSCEQALSHQFFSEYPLPCQAEQIQKLDVEYHQMFRDRSLKIQRQKRKQSVNWTDQQQQRKKKHQQIQIKISDNYRKNNYYQYDRNKYQRIYQRKPQFYQNRFQKRQRQVQIQTRNRIQPNNYHYRRNLRQSDRKQYKQFDRKQYKQFERKQYRQFDRKQYKQFQRRQYKERSIDNNSQQQYRKKISSKSDSQSSSSSSSQSRSRSRNKKTQKIQQNEDMKYKNRRNIQRQNYHDRISKDKQRPIERQRIHSIHYDRQRQHSKFRGRQIQRYDNDRKVDRQIKIYSKDIVPNHRQFRHQNKYDNHQNQDRHINRYQRIQREQREQRHPGIVNQRNYREENRRPYNSYKQREEKAPYVEFKYRSDKFQNIESNRVRKDNYENKNIHSREFHSQSMKNQYTSSRNYQSAYKSRDPNYENYRYRDHLSKESRKISVQRRQSPPPKKSINFQEY